MVIATLSKELVAEIVLARPNLRSLNLSRNEISDVEYLEPLAQLERLDLSFNRLGSLRSAACLPGLARLTDLRLAGNQLTLSEIPAALLRGLRALRGLDLSQNRIAADAAAWPRGWRPPRGSNVGLGGNPFCEAEPGYRLESSVGCRASRPSTAAPSSRPSGGTFGCCTRTLRRSAFPSPHQSPRPVPPAPARPSARARGGSSRLLAARTVPRARSAHGLRRGRSCAPALGAAWRRRRAGARGVPTPREIRQMEAEARAERDRLGRLRGTSRLAPRGALPAAAARVKKAAGPGPADARAPLAPSPRPSTPDPRPDPARIHADPRPTRTRRTAPSSVSRPRASAADPEDSAMLASLRERSRAHADALAAAVALRAAGGRRGRGRGAPARDERSLPAPRPTRARARPGEVPCDGPSAARAGGAAAVDPIPRRAPGADALDAGPASRRPTPPRRPAIPPPPPTRAPEGRGPRAVHVLTRWRQRVFELLVQRRAAADEQERRERALRARAEAAERAAAAAQRRAEVADLRARAAEAGGTSRTRPPRRTPAGFAPSWPGRGPLTARGCAAAWAAARALRGPGGGRAGEPRRGCGLDGFRGRLRFAADRLHVLQSLLRRGSSPRALRAAGGRSPHAPPAEDAVEEDKVDEEDKVEGDAEDGVVAPALRYDPITLAEPLCAEGEL